MKPISFPVFFVKVLLFLRAASFLIPLEQKTNMASVPHGVYGAITVQNSSTGNATPTAKSYVQIGTISNDVGFVAISVNGTYTGALTVSVSVVWTPLSASILTNFLTGVNGSNIASAATGVWTLPVAGLLSVRVDAQATFTGTANVGINETTLPYPASQPSQALWMLSSAAPQSGSDTVVKASAGFLYKVLVTASGSAVTPIYDNASAGSGTIIGTIPASPTVGAVYTFNSPAALGITVKGAASESSLTVFYS
jgi:hypothetical protein